MNQERHNQRNAAIRAEYTAGGMSYQALAAKYDLTQERIRQIILHPYRRGLNSARREKRNHDIVADYGTGLTPREPAHKYNMPTSKVKAILNKAGVSLRRKKSE